jgi:LAO/AO transport system ATPase/phenylacetic acid degradation protein PaaD
VKGDMPASGEDAQLAAVRSGDRRTIARLLSRIERGELSPPEVRRMFAAHLGAHIVGLTGAPGAGKSTLVHALLGELLARGQKVAVIAVDPSSPISGGAVLGDRVRMGTHGDHPNVFIRSVASRGHLGGLADSTEAMVDLLDAAGFDTVLVETVGAGQSEVEIMRVADTRIVACPPGLGDNVQSIKAGILEIADVLVVTKGDLPGAESTARDLRDMLHLRARGADGAWKVPVVTASAPQSQGITELADQVTAHATAVGHGRRLFARAQPSGIERGDPAAVQVERLFSEDAFVQLLGIRLVAAGEGTATVALTLTPDHINFNGTCHGGVTFALADTAFGLASNSHGTVAAGIDAHITYQNPSIAGDTLIAHAIEVSRSQRLAVYRVDVKRQDGKPLSSFTGTVYVTGREHAPPTDPAPLG